jgi:hypothetical protein
MAKTLIYYISVGGDKYYQQTLASIRSLRQFGCYSGDIVVITDNPMLFHGVRTVPFDSIMPKRDEKVSAPTHIMCAKPRIVRANPRVIGYHDFTLYIDSDTLIVSPRFSKLVEAMSHIGGMWVQQNYWAPVVYGGQVSMGKGLNPDAFKMCPGLSVCAGLVGFGHNAMNDMEYWSKLVEEHNFGYDDQGLLHLVAAAHNDGRVHYIPREDVWFPTNRLLSPSIYHFTHQGKVEQAELTARMFPDLCPPSSISSPPL